MLHSKLNPRVVRYIAAYSAISGMVCSAARLDPLVCGEYLTAVVTAHESVVVRDQQRAGIADIHDPFEVAARNYRGVRVAPDSTDSASAFRSDFERLLRTLTAQNFAEETQTFRARWDLPPRQLLVMLLPYALYLPVAYPGLSAALPDRLANQRALGRIKLEEYRQEHPRLEARYVYYLENRGKAVPELAAELTQSSGRAVTEPQVYRELSALFLEISSALDRPLSASERVALAVVSDDVTTAHDAALAAHANGVSTAAIGMALAITSQRLSFFLHVNGAERRAVDWDRWVQDASGIRLTEQSYLRQIDGRRLTVVEMATELNAARARFLGRNVGPGERDEFRTYAATQARRAALGLTPGNAAASHDVYVLGYGGVVAQGKLRAPEALEFLREEIARGQSYANVARRLGLSESAVREFEKKYSEVPATGLPSALNHLLDTPPGGALPSAVDTPPAGGPPHLKVAAPRSRFEKNIAAIVAFVLANEHHELGARPRRDAADPRAGETVLANALSRVKSPTDQAKALSVLASLHAYNSASETQKTLLRSIFSEKRATFEENIAAIVGFALANEHHALGARPRSQCANPRAEEIFLGRVLIKASNPKNQAKTLGIVEKLPAYLSASDVQKKLLKEMFSEKFTTFEENVAAIVAFALVNEHHALGARPRRKSANPRAEESALGSALVRLSNATYQAKALTVLKKLPAYRSASATQKTLLRELFLEKRATFEENIAAIAAFALANEHHALGPRPRAKFSNPRVGETAALGKALVKASNPKVQAKALSVLEKLPVYLGASDAQKTLLRELFLEKRATFEENIAAISAFALANENHALGARPRSKSANPRPEETTLGAALIRARNPNSRAKALSILQKLPAYIEASDAQKTLLRELFGAQMESPIPTNATIPLTE